MSLDKEVQSIPARVEDLEAVVRILGGHLTDTKEKNAALEEMVRTLHKQLGEMSEKHNLLVASCQVMIDTLKVIQEKRMADRAELDIVALTLLCFLEREDDKNG